MVVQISLEQDPPLVLARFSGAVSGAEFLTYIQQVIHDPRVPGIGGFLADFSGVESLEMTALHLSSAVELAVATRDLWHGFKVALLAPQDYVYGMARMYQAMASGDVWEVEVFRREIEARRWLHPSDREQDQK
ncbi:MAG: hypothetical protein DWQ01_09660 [Planctomycetota bacterium]|nr:MAG: hypothetical protein DWQ01_09660 [Planctomycetota bacterium]